MEKEVLVKQYLGSKFLEYVLNLNVKDDVELFEKIRESSDKKCTIDEIYKIIKHIRLQNAADDTFGEHIDLYLSRINIDFNEYRKKHGGEIYHNQNIGEDPLYDFIVDVCISLYPMLLIPNDHITFFFNRYDRYSHADIVSLLKEDELGHAGSGDSIYDYSIGIATKNGMTFNTQGRLFCGSIINRAFRNSCNRMDFSLSAVLGEIKTELNILRDLLSKMKLNILHL